MMRFRGANIKEIRERDEVEYLRLLACLPLANDLQGPVDRHTLLGYIEELEQERDRLQKVHEAELGVCEQHCDVVQEARRALETAQQLYQALQQIADLDASVDSDEGWNEWGEADCFNQAQAIARKWLEGDTTTTPRT